MSKKTIRQMVQCLKQLSNQNQYYPSLLTQSNKIFEYSEALKWAEDVKDQDLNYVLKNLNLDDNALQKVKKSYQQFNNVFDAETKIYSNEPTPATIDTLIIKTKNLGKAIENNYFYNKPPKLGEEKQRLLAYILALWVILKAQIDDQVTVYYPYRPHPAQIIAVILIFGLNNQYKQQKLANRMAQIGTGQGKSLVLATLSSYLALVGFEVNCTCYSEYLSQRDNDQFDELFDKLQIKKKVNYGTFNEHCWNLLNSFVAGQQNTNFGECIKQIILQQKQNFLQKCWKKFSNFFKFDSLDLKKIKENRKILIIDEVDVFFNKDFYGNVLPSCISLKGEQVRKVLEFIWQKISAKQKLTVKNVMKSDQYQKLVNKYKSLEQILQNQISGMIAGALNYKHNYIVNDYRIAYKDNDKISYTMNYGYKTVFANCYQYQNKNICRDFYIEAMQISLTVAEFSYSLLPKYFSYILGVTGTLFNISSFYTNQLKERYNVNNVNSRYKIPSVYGQKKREQTLKVVPDQQFYKRIVENIEDKIKDERPIICFFRTITDMNDFYHSKQFSNYQSDANTLSQQTDQYNRNLKIKQATKAKQITLMTAVFGRGTDFKIYDKQIIEKGGLHVIQCYLSVQLSQQIQVKGRAARQGKKGSYCLLIPQKQLKKIGFKQYKKETDFNEYLIEQRKIKMEQQVKIIVNSLGLAQQRHKKTTTFFEQQNLSKQKIIKFIKNLNKYPELSDNNMKVILGVDATGSMSSALSQIKNVLQDTFDKIYDILTKMGNKQSFQLQIVAYRNWNSSADQIIVASSFQNKANNLKQFLKQINPLGGHGNEALQVFYNHVNRVNKQSQISQIILIGDAAANSKEQTLQRRSYRGQQYWIQKGFSLVTEQQELKEIIKQKIPIHTFYINAADYFRSVSSKTKGKSQQFKIQFQNAADILTDFIAENILKKLGKDKGDKYVEEYQKKYRQK